MEEKELQTSIAIPSTRPKPSASRVKKAKKTGAGGELDQLIGLASVKQQVRDVIDLASVQTLRQRKGLPKLEMSQHLVFTGNPGTGKTTVARIIGDIYRELGLLRSGHFTEIDGRGLIAEYIGHTAAKTEKVIRDAMDGVLFIDEAYALVPGDISGDYGAEAIATLIKMMEDHRDRLIVILAGYEKEMERLLVSNPGLKSRFKTKIDFPDYEPAELFAIFEHLAEEQAYLLSSEASKKALALFAEMHAGRGEDFGNGRSVRNAFERAVMNQARRLVGVRRPNRKQLQLITAEDIPALKELSW
jgi:SpoVK/Ycf46/Vps4 family AAA+-type ATPase